MNVLFITQVWPQSGQNNMYSDLIDEFVDAGDNICVAVPNEKRNKIKSGLSKTEGYYLLRISCGDIQKTNKYKKVISSVFAGPSLVRYLKKYSPYSEYDVIIWALSTTLIVSSVIRIKKKYGAKLYLLLKEYWPQDPCDLGAMKQDGFLYRIFAYLEKKMVFNSDYVGTCSQAGIEYIKQRYSVDRKKLEVCPNCEKNRVPPNAERRKEILAQYGISDEKVVFLFGGNMGVSQGIDDMIDCIERASVVKEASFLLLGSGTEFSKVFNYFAGRYKNVIVRKSIDQKNFFDLCSVCDVGMLFLYKGYNVPNVPGKFTTYLNAGLPVLAAVDGTTDVGNICELNKCGFGLQNGDADTFVRKVKQMMDKNTRLEMSRNAKILFKQDYEAKICCKTIKRHF